MDLWPKVLIDKGETIWANSHSNWATMNIIISLGQMTFLWFHFACNFVWLLAKPYSFSS